MYPNKVKNFANFLKVLKDLKSYIFEFEKDRTIKTKMYLDDCIIES